MVKFKELGFDTLDDYVNNFFATLLPSNKTYTYFVDWEKAKNNINKYLDEISLLNSLTKIKGDQREDHLCNLLNKYPKIVEVNPMLIAERAKDGRIDIFDEKIEKIVSFNFNKSQINKESISQIVGFCYKTGIMDLFDEVKDLHDYLLGIEVGSDTNTRKNRSGNIFEKMVQQKISKLLGSDIYSSVYHDKSFSLYSVISEGRSKGKIHDIIIYKDNIRVLIVECSFYNVSGSKPVSISESYTDMCRAAKQHGIEFLWITDGPAWYHMREPFRRSIKDLDWVLNYKMLNLINRILLR
jgi:type II restriction enzyme